MPVQDIDGLLAWLPDELFMSISLCGHRMTGGVLYTFYLSSGRNLFHETLRVEILKPRSAEGFASVCFHLNGWEAGAGVGALPKAGGRGSVLSAHGYYG